MITKISLKTGAKKNSPNTNISTTPVTIFVGPNNSGKSRILAEIHSYCSIGPQEDNRLILESILFEENSRDKAALMLSSITYPDNKGRKPSNGNIFIGKSANRLREVQHHSIINAISNPNNNKLEFCSHFLGHETIKLDGTSRINLINSQAAGDLQGRPESSLQVLFQNNEKRERVRKIIHEAFGSYFVIDPTNLGHLRVRLSDAEPKTEIEERGIHQAATEFHKKARPIEEASDGVRAFSGIISTLIAGNPRVILIDEPEAFLHPSLAYKLGHEVSSIATETQKRVFIATHSANFLMGCIQSGVPVTIVRLTFRGEVATSRVLSDSDLVPLMRNPLLRSTGVLNAVFYESVVVTESDSDRAFYEEINNRLLKFTNNRGIPGCLFINAQNKQTIPTIVRPLRQLGISAASIVDIDVLKDGGNTWAKFLKSIYVPEVSHSGLAAQRASVLSALKSTGKDMKKDGGFDLLNDDESQGAQDLTKIIASYGAFIVPGGELESWLKHLNTPGHGPSWLIKIFEQMGENTEDSQYLRPGTDDVWAFIARIRGWLLNEERYGIPT